MLLQTRCLPNVASTISTRSASGSPHPTNSTAEIVVINDDIEFLGRRLSSRLGWFSRCFNCFRGLIAFHTSRSDGESVRPPSFTRRTIVVRSGLFWYYTMKFGGFHFQRSAASNPFAPTSSMMRWLNTAVPPMAPGVAPIICVFKNFRKHGLKWTLNWDIWTQT